MHKTAEQSEMLDEANGSGTKKAKGDSLQQLVKCVAIAIANHTIMECGRADLTDEQYEPLKELYDRLHKRVMNSGNDWLDANFGKGTWELMVKLNAELMCHEEAARGERGFSTWPIHARKLVEEGEWKVDAELARIAVDAVLRYYGHKALNVRTELPPPDTTVASKKNVQ